MPVQKCGTTFDFDQATVERLGLDEYYCPSYSNYSIAGTYYSPIFRYVELKFYKYNKNNQIICVGV